MRCPFCDAEVPEKWTYCNFCGAETGSGQLADEVITAPDSITGQVSPATATSSTPGGAFSKLGGGSLVTSGTMSSAEGVLPSGNAEADLQRVRGWNWGAFALTWIWALGNGMIDIAAIVFVVGFFPMMGFIAAVYLGITGNEILWKRKKFTSVEEFKEKQGKWSVAGLVVFALIIGFYFLLFILGAISD